MIPLQGGPPSLTKRNDALGDWLLSADSPKASRHAVFTLGYMVHGVFTTLLFALRALREVRAT